MRHPKCYFLALLLVSATVNSSVILDDKAKERQRAFSIFSVVQFPNTECVLNSDTALRGVCMSSSDCTTNSGAIDGNCASGFGVCCAFRYSTCGSTVAQNVSYIQNPGYNNAYTGTTKVTCSYSIKYPAGTCQIRLDFTNHVTTGPLVTPLGGGVVGGHSCNVDSLTFTSPTGRTYPTLCGTLTGQHMYLEVGGAQASSLTVNEIIDFTSNAVQRKYAIKVSQIPCSSTDKAPSDCTQYFTEDFGTISSMNFAGKGLIRNLNYASCIRKNAGYCTVQYNQNKDGAAGSTFFIVQTTNTAVTTAMNRLCTKGYVYIPGGAGSAPNPGQAADIFGSDQFCGNYLAIFNNSPQDSVIKATGTSFYVQHYTTNDDLEGSTGYALDYQQVPC